MVTVPPSAVAGSVIEITIRTYAADGIHLQAGEQIISAPSGCIIDQNWNGTANCDLRASKWIEHELVFQVRTPSTGWRMEVAVSKELWWNGHFQQSIETNAKVDLDPAPTCNLRTITFLPDSLSGETFVYVSGMSNYPVQAVIVKKRLPQEEEQKFILEMGEQSIDAEFDFNHGVTSQAYYYVYLKYAFGIFYCNYYVAPVISPTPTSTSSPTQTVVPSVTPTPSPTLPLAVVCYVDGVWNQYNHLATLTIRFNTNVQGLLLRDKDGFPIQSDETDYMYYHTAQMEFVWQMGMEYRLFVLWEGSLQPCARVQAPLLDPVGMLTATAIAEATQQASITPTPTSTSMPSPTPIATLQPLHTPTSTPTLSSVPTLSPPFTSTPTPVATEYIPPTPMPTPIKIATPSIKFQLIDNKFSVSVENISAVVEVFDAQGNPSFELELDGKNAKAWSFVPEQGESGSLKLIVDQDNKWGLKQEIEYNFLNGQFQTKFFYLPIVVR